MLKIASLEDLDLLVQMEQLCFRRNWNREDLQREIEENPFGQCYLFEENGRLVGYLILWKIFEQASIVRIGILPEFRRQGLGSALLDEVMVLLSRDENVEQVNLEVDAENEPALALYRKAGFVPVARIAHYYEDGSDAWRMLRFVNI